MNWLSCFVVALFVRFFTRSVKFVDETFWEFVHCNNNQQCYGELTTDEIIEEHIAMCKYGMKSRYYQNSLTSDQEDIDGKKAMQQVISSLMHKPEITQEQTTFSDDFELAESERGCGSGGCTI